MKKYPTPKTAAEALLMRLKLNGVDYLFANAGTDFAPIIEGYVRGAEEEMPFPKPLVVPHETAVVAMAHGYYLTTGKPQAAIVHVNVGLANSLCGILNAASDNIPLFMMSGRTPLTEDKHLGSRNTPIHWGQEMRDQGSIVRQSVKWDYELRYPEQISDLVDRGITIAMAPPRGPVYLSLPREPLAKMWPKEKRIDQKIQSIPLSPSPDEYACNLAMELISKAQNPLIICQRGDPEGSLSEAIGALSEGHGIPVIESFPLQNQLASDHPMHSGFNAGPWLEKSDVIIIVNTQVPWIKSMQESSKKLTLIHIALDPLFTDMPFRNFHSDLSIIGDPAKTINYLNKILLKDTQSIGQRYEKVKQENIIRRSKLKEVAAMGSGSPMSPEFVGLCLSVALDDEAVIFNELGVPVNSLNLSGPNRLFSTPFSGGLGWGFPAALGASLANPNRLAVACVGDGSYIFANPVACHQIAEAMELPVLVIIMNNGIWNAVRRAARNVYPEGSSIKMNEMPLTSLNPLPDFCQIAKASRGWSERVEKGSDLPGALMRAVNIIKTEKRHALLELRVSIPN